MKRNSKTSVPNKATAKNRHSDSEISLAMARRFASSFRGVSLDESIVEKSLLLGQNSESIEQTVGKEYADRLRQLSQEANQTRTRGGKRVLILPGILGSTLAIGKDTLWIDVLDIMRGRLKELSLVGGAKNVEPYGVFWPTYLELKFRLFRHGFNADFFPFDWRKPIAFSGKKLASYLLSEASDSRPISIVAHSMGGLVVRAAMKELGKENAKLIDRVVLLGTPNFGSYAPALVFANDYSMVRWIEGLDLASANNTLVKDVFSTFAGLAEMIPEPTYNEGINLFDTENYPALSRYARADVLMTAAGLQSRMASGSDRIHMIAGTGIDTVVSLEKSYDDPLRFTQKISREGDGTVPLKFAILPGANCYYCRCGHSELPRNDLALKATFELLEKGSTNLLSKTPGEVSRSSTSRTFRSPDQVESNLPNDAADIPNLGAALAPFLSLNRGPESITSFQGSIQSPTQDNERPSSPLSNKPIVIGRKFQNRLDLTLLRADVTQARGRALMLGVFKDVRAGGAALAVDSKIGGVLTEVIERRMFSANVGEVFVIPTPRYNIGTELVALIGLGSFSMFTAKSLRSSVENATRTLLRCDVDDIVTVPMGCGTGMSIRGVTESILDGVYAAMKDSHDRLSLRGLTIATNNSNEFTLLTKTAFDLASSSQFDGMEFTIEQSVLEPIEQRSVSNAATTLRRQETTYLFLREAPRSDGAQKRNLDVSILGVSSKAAVISDQVSIDENDLDSLLQRIAVEQEAGSRYPAEYVSKLPVLGKELAELVLPPLIREALSGSLPKSLTVINDYWSSKVPWELLSLDSWHASLNGNISRRYSTSNMSVAKWLLERRRSRTCRMLLVVDPTQDLPGANQEAVDIVQSFRIGNAIRSSVLELGKIEITEVRGPEATKSRLLEEFSSGRYDIVHYAGHADFNDVSRSQCGILCAQRDVLSGRELSKLENLPTLMVFNACESARTRSINPSSQAPKTLKRSKTGGSFADKKDTLQQAVDQSVSFAEAFLRGGVGSFIGTYWPVGDLGAALFAKAFYSKLLSKPSVSIGEALRAARETLYQKGEPDFANYIHYGDDEFQIKV